MICIQLLLHTLLFLGGWTLESVQIIFNYIVGSSKTDACVARVQSGWSNIIKEGGICPNIEAIPLVDDHELFKTWSVHLLGSVELDTASLQSLACVLLLHYRTTSQCVPGHRLHSRMKECLRMCSIIDDEEDKLLQWSDSVKVRFSIENGIYLPLESFDDDAVVPVRDIHEYMIRSETKLESNASETRRLSIEINDMKNE